LELLVQLFRKKLGEEFPPGNVVEQESPDFVVDRHMGRLGIEISEVVRSEPVAAQAGFRDKLVRGAKRLCEEWGVRPLWVTVWIIGSFNQVQGRVAQKQFAERLAKVVQDGYERRMQDSAGYFVLDQPLPEVWRIHVAPLNETAPKSLGGHYWEWKPGAVVSSPLSAGKIQARIRQKNSRYERYCQSCDECWLVLVGDSFDYKMGCDISRSPSVVTNLYDSQFERVFYLQLYDILIELGKRIV